MKNQVYIGMLTLILLWSVDASSQTCVCTDCPIQILDNSLATSCIDVSGLTNATLNAGGQGVCGIEIQFDHTWLTEVSFTLIAPNGSSVTLVPNAGGGPTPNSSWDIDFVPCGDPADPDPGFPAVFDPAGYSNDFYTGTYYPGIGCFEDLTGSANGSWKLDVEDFAFADEGEVTSWSITFCDGTGLVCSQDVSCEADVGTYSTESQFVCINGPTFTTAPTVTGQAPLPEYDYTFTISNFDSGSGTDIIAYSETADFSGFAEGYYWVCGLSYLSTDEPLLPAPDGILTNDDIQTDIDNMEYCADISSNCYVVQVQVPQSPELIAPDTLCVGEEGVLEWSNFDDNYLWQISVSGGFSSLDAVTSFPTIFYSGNGGSDEIEICLTALSACGDSTACITTVITGPSDPEILGETETCYGNNYEYAISSLEGIVSYNWFIDPNEDSFIIGSNMDSTVNVGLPAGPDQFSASICVEYLDICGNEETICIDITPEEITIINDLTPDLFCSLTGEFNVEAVGTGAGTWVQDNGPGTSVFGNQNQLNTTVTVTEPGVYNFTYTSDCGNVLTVEIEFLAPPPTPMIDGQFTGCPGELLTFSLLDLDPNIVVGWTITGDATISGADDQNTVDILLNDPGTNATTTICVEYQNQCNEISEVCENIVLIEEELTNLTASDFCGLDFTLNVQVNGMSGSGLWSLVSGPGDVIIESDMTSITNVSADQFGIYTFEFVASSCNSNIQVMVTLFEALGFENLLVDCIGEDFIVSFDITGGNEPYQVDGNAVAGNMFASSVLSGDTFSFLVIDDSNCDALSIAGDSECECVSNAGSISPSGLIGSCNNEMISITTNGDAVFDENDNAIFILFTDLLDPLGSIAFESNLGDFSFVPPLQYGTVYYVGYVVGNELAGTVDFMDPCIDIASGTSIIFYEPFGLSEIISADVDGCEIEVSLTAVQNTNEIGDWSVVESPDGSSVLFNDVSGISTQATFSEAGTYTIQYTIDNDFCTDSIQVTIEAMAAEEFAVVNVSYNCDENFENYQVSFEIVGGVAPILVDGEVITDNLFTSDFIPSGDVMAFLISDSNGCEEVTFLSEFTCIDDCVSYAEMTQIETIQLCEDETVSVSESGNSILESDDVGVYVLHTNSGNVLGTILEQNSTGIFSFNSDLEYGVVYYISFVVGKEVDGDIDLTDPCLSVAPGQGIIFFQQPSLDISIDTTVCGLEFQVETEYLGQGLFTWSTISSPDGAGVDFSDTFALNTNIMVNLYGAYEFKLEVENGPCSSFDTIIIAFLEPSEVNVMDDFATCEFTVELYAQTSGTPKFWEVLDATNVSFADSESDTTVVTFQSPGIYEIIRQAGTGICMKMDTVVVEIYPTSSFLINEIICDEDNSTYTVDYAIEGQSYPYTINGQEVNEGEVVDLISGSEDTLIIEVVDANLCQVFLDTIVHSCACESIPGQMDSVLIEACFGESIQVIPSVGSVITEEDSLIYVLHDANGTVITNILLISTDRMFAFDDQILSPNTIYYVSAVVFEGNDFNASTLNETCTLVSSGTPVLWLPENVVTLPGDLEFCAGDDDITITVDYSGVVPITLEISDEAGNLFELLINDEGQTSFTIDIVDSGEFSINNYIGTSCDVSVSGTLNINIRALPQVDFVSDIIVCNSSITGSTIMLEDLIATSNSEGIWTDPEGNTVSGVVDFGGEAPGEYMYQFATIGNSPCPESVFSVTILVEECDCPVDIFLPFENLCQGEYEFDLNEYLKPDFIGNGQWSVATVDGVGSLTMLDTMLSIDFSNVGLFQLSYVLDEVPEGCDATFTIDLEIESQFSSGTFGLEAIELCVGDLQEILLFDYLEGYDEGGTWNSLSDLPVDLLSGIVDLSEADGGLYTFEYVFAESENCPSASTELTVILHDPLSVFLSILDPLCFGINDGSVEVEDANGQGLNFTLFNDEAELVSNPDSLFAGNYEVVLIDSNGCVIIENFSLVDPLELFLDLGDDKEVEEGTVTTISPVINIGGGEIALFEWFINQASLDVPTLDTLTLAPDNETLVQLIITDMDGCIVADDLLLTVLNRDVDVVLPNIFNPSNSTFGVESFEEISLVNQFSIFDRWGSVIFNEENFMPGDPTKRWDGSYDGVIVENGVYVFILRYTNQEGDSVSLFGDVAVVR